MRARVGPLARLAPRASACFNEFHCGTPCAPRAGRSPLAWAMHLTPRMTTQTDFMRRVPTVSLRDPLGEFLGALPEGGTFEYSYLDAVKLCGHSCPTVARGYLLTVVALRALYGEETPVRGELEVTVGGTPDDGSTGPLASVVSLLTGAATETGFGGLAGRWARRGLLHFDLALADVIRFRRRDTGATVEVSLDASVAPSLPGLRASLVAALAPDATPAQQRTFATQWQGRVEQLLTADPARAVRVHRVS